MTSFASISGFGLLLKQASKNLKIPVPRGGLAESVILSKMNAVAHAQLIFQMLTLLQKQ